MCLRHTARNHQVIEYCANSVTSVHLSLLVGLSTKNCLLGLIKVN
jgi:hypothetical protein